LRLIEAGFVIDRSALADEWRRTVGETFAEATLTVPADSWSMRGGRDGIHTEHLGYLLAEMQFMQRAYPGQRW
jgi:ring-1,2-phenylacetyl-CoA epoxidase subunit PaaC